MAESSGTLNNLVEYFKSIALPIQNNIANKIKNLEDGDEKELLAVLLGSVATKFVCLFFKPDMNSSIKDVKDYSQQDFERLFAIPMIWVYFDFINFPESEIKPDDFKNKLQNILGLNEADFNFYLQQLNHKTETPMKLELLWNETLKILTTLPNTPENYLVFHRDFSRICKEAFQS